MANAGCDLARPTFTASTPQDGSTPLDGHSGGAADSAQLSPYIYPVRGIESE